MDKHFYASPFRENMPCIMGMLAIWYFNFANAPSAALLPYAHDLRAFPAYIQQLEMESNGKRVSKAGQLLPWRTIGTIWGGEGSNSQHAFLQMLHQGTDLIPVDFIIPKRSYYTDQSYHHWLVAHCLGQSHTLWVGDKEQASHKQLPGGRPSNTLVLSRTTPSVLGSLIALYEHKTFVQSIIWHINAFDQWGVEAAKTMVEKLHASLSNTSQKARYDSSTEGLIQHCQDI